MFKIAVKHFLYDFCIDLIFKSIKANFNNNTSNKFPKVGEYYSRVSHKYDDENYRNCIVKGVEKRINKSNENYYLIHIKYEYTSGKIFNDDEWAEDKLNEYFDEEFEKELNEGGDNYKDWHDNEKVESVDMDGNLVFNYNHYIFYR